MIDFSNMWGVLAGLLDFSLRMYFWVVIAAVLISWVPLDTTNQTARGIARFLHRATEPTFSFFRKTLRLQRFTTPLDLTPILVILSISFLRIFLVRTLQDMAHITYAAQILRFTTANFLLAILFTVAEILDLYFWIVIIAVIVSWIPLDPYHPLARMILMFLRRLTEPVFGYLRQKLNLHRYTAPLDVTPILVIIVIRLIQNVLIANAVALVGQLRYL